MVSGGALSLEHVRRQLADLEDLLEAGYWDLDLDSGVVDWSPGQCRLYGVGADFEANYETWFAMVHPDDQAMIAATIEAAIAQVGTYGFEHRFYRADDGALRWTRCRGRVTPGPDGTAARVCGVSIDTTEAHRSARDVGEFLANAAHELKTPAAAIAQAVHALQSGLGPADREAVLAILARQANRLRSLTTNLTDLSRLEIDPDAALLQSVDLRGAIEAALELAPPPPGDSIEVGDVAPGLVVRADPVDLERVLVNLLINAWRYGGSRVSVNARRERDRTGERVVVEVADDGEGVADEQRAGLFEPFRRGPQRHPEASGLGLAIVEGLQRRMGGTVAYRAGEPGAVFVLTFDVG